MAIVVTSPVTAVVTATTGLDDGTVGAPAVAFLSDATTGLYKSAGSTVGVACAGAVAFEFSATALNCHNIHLTNVGNITCKSTGQALINLNACTGIAAGMAVSAVGTFAGIAAGAVCTSVASIAGIGAGMALTAVASSAGIAAGQDITATKTIVGIAAGVDITAVKSLAFIGGLGAITNCSSIDSPSATVSVRGQMSAADKFYLDGVHAAAGTTLTDTATQTIQRSEGGWRKLPTLGQGGVLTLGTVAAIAGDQIDITRTDTSAFTYAVVNGGAGAGTLFTMPVSKVCCAKFQFDGTNWALRSFGQLA